MSDGITGNDSNRVQELVCSVTRSVVRCMSGLSCVEVFSEMWPAVVNCFYNLTKH